MDTNEYLAANPLYEDQQSSFDVADNGAASGGNYTSPGWMQNLFGLANTGATLYTAFKGNKSQPTTTPGATPVATGTGLVQTRPASPGWMKWAIGGAVAAVAILLGVLLMRKRKG